MPSRAAFSIVAFTAAWLLAPLPVQAQPYARLDVPDANLDQALRDQSANFENLWNGLLVSWLRARIAGADSAQRLAALAGRVAAAEPGALGTRIAAEAFERYRDRPPDTLAIRVRAAVEESLGARARAEADFETAEVHYRTALIEYRRADEPRRAAWVLGSLGGLALDHRLNLEADSLLAEALAARRALGDPRMVGNTLFDLGLANVRLGRHQVAHRHFSESREIRERTGQIPQLGSTLAFLGLTLAELGKPDSAWAGFERGIGLTSSAGDSARTLVALINYSKALGDHGLDQRAIAVNRRAMTIAEELGAHSDQATLRHNLGDVLRRATRYTEALESYQAAAALCAEAGLDAQLALTLNEIGRLWLSLGIAGPARPPLARARALADSLGDPAMGAMVRINQSWVAQLLGDAGRARRLGSEALAMAVAAADSQRAYDAAAQLGDLAIARGGYAEAERMLSRALANGLAGRPEDRATALVQRSLARQLDGRLGEVEGDLREAIGIAERIGAPEIASAAWLNLGDVAERQRDFGRAFERYFRALDLIDTLRARQRSEAHAITAFANRQAPYEAVIHLLGKLDASAPDSGYAARAFQWAERARARALLDRTAHDAGISAPRIVSLVEAQALLPTPRSVLLHYSVGDSSTSLWVIRAGDWHHFRLASRAALSGPVAVLRTSIAARGGTATAAFRDAQHRLYSRLIAPAESLLATADELIVSANDPLTSLPFEALRPRAAAGARAPYLVERFAVSYVPSASLLGALDHAAAGPAIVAVGNPDFGPTGLPAATFRGIGGVSESPTPAAPTAVAGAGALAPLPGTARELKALEAAGRGRRVVVLSGRDATRARLLALSELRDAAVVHIATHGIANEWEPARSGLWLAAESDSEPPGFLGLPEVSRLRLRASLVTLSACETALGRSERGEGVIGLARGFIAAGARSVVVSQWRVADRATAELMERFYRALLVEGRSRAQALAEAKRALLLQEATRSPHLWAPFVLVGRSGPLE